jgi:Flp pilus assembly protein TadD
VLLAASLGLLLSELVALVSIPGSWSPRRERDRAVLAGERPALEALAQSPLDPFLHLALAREHAARGDWEACLARAEVAATLRPASLDANMLAAVAAASLGRELESIEHLRRGLEAVRDPVSPELVAWLVESTPDPAGLAELAPHDPEAWAALSRALAAVSPEHARALARARRLSDPEDPEPLALLARLALDERNPGLALHHARLLVDLRPHEARSHRLRAQARFARGTLEQTRRAVVELEEARERGRVDDRGVVDELLVIGLIKLEDPASLARARELMTELLAQRAEPRIRQRREALEAKLEALESAR